MQPHNLTLTLLGAALLWFGWFGFNGGSAVASGSLATAAFVATHIAGAAAALAWVTMEWLRAGKPTALGAASGAVAGLVAITPASGYVEPLSALAIGVIGGVVCYIAVSAKRRIGYDDSLDAVGIHGAGVVWGALATGLFASSAVNSAGANGAFFGNVGLLQSQIMSIVAATVYSFTISFVILKVLDKTIGLRLTPEEEYEGLDLSQHGESGFTL